MWRRFTNRAEGGHALGAEVERHIGKRDDVIVLGLPRGGVPVAHAVAATIGAPMDVFIVRKLGFPGHEELAMGAIASGGSTRIAAIVRRSMCAGERSSSLTTDSRPDRRCAPPFAR